MILSKSNVRIRCGVDGSSGNNCILSGGTFQLGFLRSLDNTASKWFRNPIMNVIVEGITFKASTEYNVWAQNDGSLTLIDCVFADNENIAPVFAMLPDSNFHRSLASDRKMQLSLANSAAPSLNVNITQCHFLVSCQLSLFYSCRSCSAHLPTRTTDCQKSLKVCLYLTAHLLKSVIP